MHLSLSTNTGAATAPTATGTLAGPATVPFDEGTRATWFKIASDQASPDAHGTTTGLKAVNGDSAQLFSSLHEAIGAASKQTAGALPAAAVLQAAEGQWGIYSMFAQHGTSVPDQTALGSHFEYGVPGQFAFEGAAYPWQQLAHAPLVGAMVDGASVWKPSFDPGS